jgi:hypothetical protein
MNERIGFERELALLGTAPTDFDTPVDAGTPVLVLDRAETNFWNANFERKPSGLLRAFFCKPFTSPSMVFKLFGHVEIETKGVRRPLVKADKKTFPRLRVTPWIRAKAGVKAAVGGSALVKDDGTFVSTSSVVIAKGERQISVRVDLEWSGGKASVEAAIDHSDLDCFIQVIRRHERAKSAQQTPFEFLSSVRQMFQPAPGSPLAGLFPRVLHRTKDVKPLVDFGSAEGKSIRLFENMEINGAKVDIGHALIGIEAHRRQKPGAWGLPVAWSAEQIEALLTWSGDLGAVLAWVAQETPLAGLSAKPDLKRLLSEKASYEDLRGDLDGMNLGAIYDESANFGDNLRKYYDVKPFRRFHIFIANAKDASGNPVFRLTGGKLDPAARATVASQMQLVTHSYLMLFSRRYSGMTDRQQLQALDIGRVGSNQSNVIVDYFFEFLNKGVASEI